jgi:hypothetical protein
MVLCSMDGKVGLLELLVQKRVGASGSDARGERQQCYENAGAYSHWLAPLKGMILGMAGELAEHARILVILAGLVTVHWKMFLPKNKSNR